MLSLLIIGNGGRQHALAWKFAQDSRIEKIYIAPGNAGARELEICENVNLTTIDEMVDFAKKNAIDLTIIGPEVYLVEGIVDAFTQAKLPIFGPNKQTAQLEGSKRYAKDFMQKYGVKTAQYQTFSQLDQALNYIESCEYPTVVKASGIAAGKGVVICDNKAEAKMALLEIMENRRFGDAGTEVVIEAFLTGYEVSLLSFCDGNTILPMLAAKDHKTIGENNTGENTGGMGVVAPHPQFTEKEFKAFERDILTPTIKGIKAENMDFSGIIFFGLMINDNGVHLLEYNMRFGDPETQTVLPLLENSLLDVIEACLAKKLEDVTLQWKNEASVCVVAASKGYPRVFETHKQISGLEKARFFSYIFLAGAVEKDEQYYTSGGRVLNVVGLGKNILDAKKNAYSGINAVQFEGKIFRKDIGA